MPRPSARSDEDYMQVALELAAQPRALPYPNPWVGCVIVRSGKIVGKGFHLGPGTPHAEVMALAQAGRHARDATLYSTLEPCCHYGKTPPCTDAILAAGIRRVVYALRDPNPSVRGRSARILKSRGVKVQSGVLSEQAAETNEAYLKYRATRLPFVTAKVATTLDGKIATRTGQSKWITDEKARRHSRLLREQNQAVLVGINTVLADDPHLGARRRGIAEPWRVVLDSNLQIRPGSKVVRSGRCIIACAGGATQERMTRLMTKGATVWKFHGDKIPLRTLLLKLAEAGILSLLVEGGAETLGSFFDDGLVDRVCWYLAPVIVGSHQSRAAVAGRGVDSLAKAWRLRNPAISRAGGAFFVQGNFSRWALKPATI